MRSACDAADWSLLKKISLLIFFCTSSVLFGNNKAFTQERRLLVPGLPAPLDHAILVDWLRHLYRLSLSNKMSQWLNTSQLQRRSLWAWSSDGSEIVTAQNFSAKRMRPSEEPVSCCPCRANPEHRTILLRWKHKLCEHKQSLNQKNSTLTFRLRMTRPKVERKILSHAHILTHYHICPDVHTLIMRYARYNQNQMHGFTLLATLSRICGTHCGAKNCLMKWRNPLELHASLNLMETNVGQKLLWARCRNERLD
jgi:hypothetical protein